jgi:hypothetical protein
MDKLADIEYKYDKSKQCRIYWYTKKKAHEYKSTPLCLRLFLRQKCQMDYIQKKSFWKYW